MKRKSKKRAIITAMICLAVAIPTVVMPVVTAAVYESVFGVRYETQGWLKFSASDYEGLSVKRSDFISNGMTLAGYKYTKSNQDVKGVVVISHGMGGGGHNFYMPLVDVFTSNGYLVFAYDARGNDNSQGNSVEGLPQGVVDLDNALCHIRNDDEYKNLPVALIGHSWGGYSVANVLKTHPEVKAAVVVAGFNESEDLLEYQGKAFTGMSTTPVMPYLKLYERIKFGKKYTKSTALDSMASSDAGIMIIHSKDDETVPTKYGYDKFYEEFAEDNRFEFLLYEDRGHSFILYSDDSKAYRDELNENYKNYVESSGKEYSEETKSEFMATHLDKKKCFEPDKELMERIVGLFDEWC